MSTPADQLADMQFRRLDDEVREQGPVVVDGHQQVLARQDRPLARAEQLSLQKESEGVFRLHRGFVHAREVTLWGKAITPAVREIAPSTGLFLKVTVTDQYNSNLERDSVSSVPSRVFYKTGRKLITDADIEIHALPFSPTSSYEGDFTDTLVHGGKSIVWVPLDYVGSDGEVVPQLRGQVLMDFLNFAITDLGKKV